MKYGNLNLGQIEALVNKLGGMDVVDNILRGVVGVTIMVISYITQIFTVLVDETKTVEELVREGKFNWSNSDITSKNFPKHGGKTEKREISLFHFNKTMTSDQVIDEMDKAGYRPATIWELLCLAVAQPNIQREFPVIALGSVCVIGGNRHVADLCRLAGWRYLDLLWFGHVWNDRCRFAGVRK